MSEQAESGNVGAGIDLKRRGRFGGGTVERSHALNRRGKLLGRQKIRLSRRIQDARAKRFCQNQPISGLCAGICQYFMRIDKSADTKPIFRLVVLNGVAARKNGAGLLDLVAAAREDFAHSLLVEAGGIAKQVHRQLRRAAHRIDIGQCVCCGDLPKGIWVVDNRWEEIDRLYKRERIADAVYAGVVAFIKSDKQIRIVKGW